MKALTAAQMREVDRLTIERGIPGVVLMENAGQRVIELLEEKFRPLASQRITVLCGKGNNGGDGLAIARQLWTRIRPAELRVVLLAAPEDLKGDAAENLKMLHACGCPLQHEIDETARRASLVIDALLGTGVSGAASGRMLEAIQAINSGFPLARVVAVDMPSGMTSDGGDSGGEVARADYTVTFTAPKIGQVLAPNCTRLGELRVAQIGSPAELYESDRSIYVSVVQARDFAPLLARRKPGGHKGDYGHVLAIAGSRGKTGAAAMTAMGALCAGAGLVTVASAESAAPVIAGHAPELMTEPLPETPAGGISQRAFDYGRLSSIATGKDVIAMGPGLGTDPETVDIVRRAAGAFAVPMVIDADGLNALANQEIPAPALRVLTPHPGEMSRLTGRDTREIQRDRICAAREFAMQRGLCLVLKGHRTAIAFADGRVWINPTGTPAMATGGTGDVLTGLIAGFLAQFPSMPDIAIAAAVFLHGLAGEIGARARGEKAFRATDLIEFFPAAVEECGRLPDRF